MLGNDEAKRRQDRLERLRRLGVRRGTRDLPHPPERRPAPEAGILPGEEVDTPFGPVWARTARFPLAERPDLAQWLRAEPEALAALGRDVSLATLDPAGVVFLDTETTGLSVDTGTYTFLIGIGSYALPEPGAVRKAGRPEGEFVVKQFFMRNPAEERAQLHLVEEVLAGCGGMVTFNGKAFDLPLVQSRFVLARMPWPIPGVPHLDLLPPSRRVWRARHGSCALGNLEQKVLALQRTVEDVPGWMIPDIYREYYRTGIATDMLAHVFYHNLQDILSMVLLAERLGRLFRVAEFTEEVARLHPLECLSLGRCYEMLDWVEAGIVAYRAALDGLAALPEQSEGLRSLSFLYKRLGRWDEAAALWEQWIGTIPGDDLTPYVELAKYHEWHTTDLDAARGWAAWALRIAEGGAPGSYREDAMATLRHRLARLEGKRAGAPAATDIEE